MGIFESTWWFYKNNIDLVPSFMANTAELYMNRQNGVIVGFYNTSHTVELSNWTMFDDDPNVDPPPPEYNPDELLEEQSDEESSEKEKPSVRSGNPMLEFNLLDLESK